MTNETLRNQTREALRVKAAQLWAESLEVTAQHYDVEAEIDRIDGDELRAEFHSALADCYRNKPGAWGRKERACAALGVKP